MGGFLTVCMGLKINDGYQRNANITKHPLAENWNISL